MFDYLARRSTLKRVYVLIDRATASRKMTRTCCTLDKAAVSYQIVLTKTDKIKGGRRAAPRRRTLEKIKKRPAAFPEWLSTSSEKGEGIEDLRAAIEAWP